MSLSAFFLCAGYGTRLKPLTDRIPKPAIPFLGRSALEINVRAADVLQPAQRLANAHHLPDAIRNIARSLSDPSRAQSREAEGRGRMEVLFEPGILGTGGALANAAERLRETDHFLVHNGDLIHGIDLAALYQEHLDSGALATLAGLHLEKGPNTLSVSAEGTLLGIHGFHPPEGQEEKRLTFAGIAFYRREFLDFVTPGPDDIKPHWIRALEKAQDKTGALEKTQNKTGTPERDPAPVGGRGWGGGGPAAVDDTLARRSQPGDDVIRVVDITGTPWFDFGTPQGLWDALRFRMEASRTFAYNYPAPPGTFPRVSNEANVAGLPEGLRNVAIYEAPRIPLEPGTTNLLTGYDFDWKVRPA